MASSALLVHAIEKPNDWDINYEKLKAFRKRNGHSKVPKHYSEDMQLALWVAEQRRQYKLYASVRSDGERENMFREGSLSLDSTHYRKLEDIGFEFTNKNPRHMRWDFRYQQLKEFVRLYGHSQVPIGWEENVKLANWVSTQRQEFKNMKKGRTSQLNEQRIQLLNDLGFAWEVQRGGRRRQLSPNPVAGIKMPLKKLVGDSAHILPGKALVGGQDGVPMAMPTKKSGPPVKKAKHMRPGEQAPMPAQMVMQQQLQMRQQQMMFHQQQQQRFAAAAAAAGQGVWQRPGQPGLLGAHALNFGGWPNMAAAANMGAFPGRVMSQGYPMAAAAPGMMRQPMAPSTPLEMALASSNNRSRSDPPADPLPKAGLKLSQTARRPSRADPPTDPPIKAGSPAKPQGVGGSSLPSSQAAVIANDQSRETAAFESTTPS